MKDHFERFLGQGNASDNAADLIAYSYDGSELAGTARIVLFPSQDEQLRLILSYANRSSIDVIPRGFGTGNVGGAVPESSIVVSMLGFDRVVALNLREAWVHVEAGVTIAQLNEALSEHNVRYALEPFTANTTTIGAFLAENGTSRHGLGKGRARDTVIELEVMDGTGKMLTTKTELDEVIGSEGTLGIIVRAKVKVEPIVERTADIIFFDTLSQAIQRSFEIAEGERKPVAMEYLDPVAATYAGINTKHTLIVEYEDILAGLKHEVYAATITKRANVRRRLGEQGYVIMEDSLVPPAAREHEPIVRGLQKAQLPLYSSCMLNQGTIYNIALHKL